MFFVGVRYLMKTKWLVGWFLVVLIAVSRSSLAAVPAGEWVQVNLSQIEFTPAEGWFVGEGIWFANDVSYDTQFTCVKDRYVGIMRPTLIDRAFSSALYAKSMGGGLKIYVVGCDANGYLDGRAIMLVD